MKEKYQIFARKYRPQVFSDVIGQEAIVQTLKNSLKYNKASQAYLFSGPRGVGKTTLTRLYAKALNCKNIDENFEPCNKCSSCQEITNSSSLDVIEIDGASNRGIDDIRQINSTIGYAPSHGNYKIYIIDEVHMLTKEAFNALLKTLEEPPKSIKFFFATTEMHKVLPTIISRCQRFDLKPISNEKITSKLKEITEDQKREIMNDAAEVLSILADGSLRDAESMLDQILCFHEGSIDKNVINDIFGLIPTTYFSKVDEAFITGNISIALEISDILYKEGKDFSHFIEQLIEHFRKKIKLSIQKTKDSIYTLDQCLTIIDILVKALDQIKTSPSKQCALETVLIQIIQSKNKISIKSIVKRLLEIEKNISSPPTNNENQQTKLPTIQEPSKEIDDNKETARTPSDYQASSKSTNSNQKNIEDQKNGTTAETPKIEENKIELGEVPFQINAKKSIPSENKNKDHYDTLLNFTAVELDGIIKKD